MSGTRRGVGLFTVRLASQLEYLMHHVRRELNVSVAHEGKLKGSYLKRDGQGLRFVYAIDCIDCDHTFREIYARAAITTLLHHVDRGHSVNVLEPKPRDRDEFEERNAAYPDNRPRKPKAAAAVFYDVPPDPVPEGKSVIRTGRGYLLVDEDVASAL